MVGARNGADSVPMPLTTKQRLLRNAAELLGPVELAELLNISVPLLEAWMGGQASMPDRKLVLLTAMLDEIGVHG